MPTTPHHGVYLCLIHDHEYSNCNLIFVLKIIYCSECHATAGQNIQFVHNSLCKDILPYT